MVECNKWLFGVPVALMQILTRVMEVYYCENVVFLRDFGDLMGFGILVDLMILEVLEYFDFRESLVLVA